jgi:hypothetical protein
MSRSNSSGKEPGCVKERDSGLDGIRSGKCGTGGGLPEDGGVGLHRAESCTGTVAAFCLKLLPLSGFFKKYPLRTKITTA